MVSLLIVSHSETLAKGVAELVKQMAPEIVIKAVGGDAEGNLGNDYDKIYDSLNKIYTDDGVIILFDLGSSYMITEMVIEELVGSGKCNIHIVDAPLVEGAMVASVEISMDKKIDNILDKLSSMKIGKI